MNLNFSIAILCFLCAIMVYCVIKSGQAFHDLRKTWKEYKKAGEDLIDFIKEQNENNKHS